MANGADAKASRERLEIKVRAMQWRRMIGGYDPWKSFCDAAREWMNLQPKPGRASGSPAVDAEEEPLQDKVDQEEGECGPCDVVFAEKVDGCCTPNNPWIP